MRERIKLKQLSAYLPYKLKGSLEYRNGRIDQILTRENIYSKTFIPYLHPLSDLTKDHLDEREAEHIRLLKGITNGSVHEEDFIEHIVDFYDKVDEVDFMQTPYRLMEYLFENHFDVFGLIDKGLAIDINSL